MAASDRLSSRSSVERTLRWQIGTGERKPGEALPNERELARQLGVGRSTLRSAIDALRADGLLETSMGRSGSTRVMEPTAPARALPSGPEARQEILHHFELRRAVEPVAAELAAQRGTTTDFDRLRDILHQPVTGVRSYCALNSQFHIAVAEATGNPLIRNAIAELCVDFFSWADALASLGEARYRDFALTHKGIYESLMTRDAAGARDEVTAHLIEAQDMYLELLGYTAHNGHSTSSCDE